MTSRTIESTGKWILLALTALVYARGMMGEFVWDDTTYFVENDILTQLQPWDLSAFFTQSITYWGGISPIKGILFVFQYHFFGTYTPAYHLVSLLLYLAVGFLTWKFVSNLFSQISPRTSIDSASKNYGFSILLVLAIFLLHPTHVEAVAYISAQPYLLYSLFSLTALNLLWRGRAKGGYYQPLCLWLAIACYYLAVLSHVQAFATGLFIPALWLILRRERERNLIKPIFFWAVINVPLLIWLKFATGSSQFVGQTDVNFLESLLRGLRILGAHLILAIKPYPLNFGYPFDHKWSWDGNFVAGLMVLISLGMALLYARRSLVTVGLLIFTIFLFPAMQIFIEVTNATIFDRYLFLPVLGLALVVERGFSLVIEHQPKLTGVTKTFAVAIVLTLAALTAVYMPKFGSNIASLEHGYRMFPGWKRVAFDYQTALIEGGQFSEAVKLVETEETFSEPTWVRDYFRGRIELERGNVIGAITYLENASREIHRGGYFPFTGVPLGRAYMEVGRLDLAEIFLKDVLASPLNNPIEEYRARKYLLELEALEERKISD